MKAFAKRILMRKRRFEVRKYTCYSLLFIAALFVVFAAGCEKGAGPDPVALGQASQFAVLAGYAITNVPASAITGNVGISPAAESFIAGFSQTDWTGYATSPQVTGSIYASDMADPTPAMLTQAKGDLTIAYNDAAGRTPVPTGPFLNPGDGNLAGLDLVPGLYKFTGEAIATTDFTLTGGANDVWIFQIATALTISNGVQVTLAGGAKAKNIFWQVGTQAVLGTTVIFYGTIMADASVTMDTGATLNGRALAFTETIALDQNIITIPAL
ncbi:MAG: ice-binding family protein [Proteobacteria bacterium]|nr:ice-binding family protein [Pseudomonadota bacterium]